MVTVSGTGVFLQCSFPVNAKSSTVVSLIFNNKHIKNVSVEQGPFCCMGFHFRPGHFCNQGESLLRCKVEMRFLYIDAALNNACGHTVAACSDCHLRCLNR